MIKIITQNKLDLLLKQSYEQGKQEASNWKADVLKTMDLYLTRNEDRKHTFITEPVTIMKGGSMKIDGDVFMIQLDNHSGIVIIKGNLYFPGDIHNSDGSKVVFVNHDHLKNRVVNKDR